MQFSKFNFKNIKFSIKLALYLFLSLFMSIPIWENTLSASALVAGIENNSKAICVRYG